MFALKNSASAPLRTRAGAILALGLALWTMDSTNVRAGFIVTVQTTTASAGSTGNAFDITLTNTGPDSVDIGGFAVEVSVASPSPITFTGATIATSPSPYIFGGDGLFGPDIGIVGPGGTSIQASDIFSVIGSGATLASGQTVGLAHVVFDVAAGAAPGDIQVSLTPFPTTNLSDVNGGNVAIDTLTNGTIHIAGTPVIPEPASVTLAGIGLLIVAGMRGLGRGRLHPAR